MSLSWVRTYSRRMALFFAGLYLVAVAATEVAGGGR